MEGERTRERGRDSKSGQEDMMWGRQEAQNIASAPRQV